MSNQDVVILHNGAFSNTSVCEISLEGNNIQEMYPHAFEGWVRGSNCTDDSVVQQCTDLESWDVSLSTNNVRVECDVFETLDARTQGFYLGIEGSAGRTAAEACCVVGGGTRDSSYLRIDSHSTISCTFESSNVTCMCGDETYRYFTNENTCLGFCDAGKYWSNASNASDYTLFAGTVVGECLDCPRGEIGRTDVKQWPETCTKCQPGEYSDLEGATSCEACSKHHISNSTGASICVECPTGRKSSSDRTDCISCSWIYQGSKHCEVAVTGIIVVSASLGLLVFLSLLIFLRCRHIRRKKKQIKNKVLDTRKLLRTAHDDIALMSSAWRFDFSEVRLDEKIASGGEGSVYKGALHEKWIVAVKTTHMSFDMDATEDAEIKFLQRTRHPRLVMFLGMGHTDENKLFVVLEYMEGGSLDRILWMKKYDLKCEPSWEQRLQVLVDVAEGMTYVHSIMGSVHRDLKSPNVLLTKDARTNSNVEFRAKVTDFGLTKVMDSVTPREHVKKLLQAAVVSSDDEDDDDDDEKTHESSSDEEQDGGGEVVHKVRKTNLRQTMTSERGTVPWMAPELFDESSHMSEYSQSVDVYAFACICWESLCLNQPWGRARSVSLSSIRVGVTSGQRPALPTHLSSDVPNGFVSMLTKCWSQDPESRPSFPVVLSKLQHMQIDYHNTKKTFDMSSSDLREHGNGGSAASGGAIEMVSIGHQQTTT